MAAALYVMAKNVGPKNGPTLGEDQGHRDAGNSARRSQIDVRREPSPHPKTIFGATENMKKTNPTILWLSLHFPKTLKNAYIRAVFSLFADRYNRYRHMAPLTVPPMTYLYA
jgi:hypothetical protein